MPPDREVLFHRASQVGAVWRGLSHDLVEDFVVDRDVLELLLQKETDEDGHRESENHVVRGRFDTWTHHVTRSKPAETRRHEEFIDQNLRLMPVEMLHLDDFILRQVVILKACE